MNAHLYQRQTLPKVDDMGRVESSDTARNGLLKAAEGKDTQSRDKEENNVAPTVEEVTTAVASAGRLEPKENYRRVGAWMAVKRKYHLGGQPSKGRGTRQN